MNERGFLKFDWIRHTFGSHAVADDMPLDVVQYILGHESLNDFDLCDGRAIAAHQGDPKTQR